MRLNIGSGQRAVPGWINIDRSPGIYLDRVRVVKHALHRLGVLSDGHLTPWSRLIVRHDIRRPLPYPDRSAEAIYSSHTLEHLYLADVSRVLKECARLLRPGGILRLALPDSERLAQELITATESGDPDAGFTFNRQLLAHPDTRPRGPKRIVAWLSGSVHRWQPVPSMVERLLRDAGFAEVRRCGYREGSLPELELIENRPNSFFVEAIPAGSHTRRSTGHDGHAARPP